MGDYNQDITDSNGPTSGESYVLIPLSVPLYTTSLTISFKYAFSGFDNDPSYNDGFYIWIQDSTNQTITNLAHGSTVNLPNQTDANLIDGIVNVTVPWSNSYSSDLSFYIQVIEKESADTQTALAIDDLLVTANVSTPVPIPGAVWLLASGLLGLIGVRRFRR